MRRTTLDPTAGKRARRIMMLEGAPELIIDPTDPRCEAASPEDRGWTPEVIFDPTNPHCQELPA